MLVIVACLSKGAAKMSKIKGEKETKKGEKNIIKHMFILIDTVFL
jgi:hypothetical protein